MTDSVVAPKSALTQIPVSTLRGVGPRSAEKLADSGIHTVFDVLMQLPLRYEDRSQIACIADLKPEQSVHIQGRVLSSKVIFAKRRQLLCQVEDETGRLNLRFFHFTQAQQQGLAVVGAGIRVYGTARQGRSGYEMIHPSYQLGESALEPLPQQTTYTPVYRASQGLQAAFWLKMAEQACLLLAQDPALLADPIPARLRGQHRLPLLSEALLFAHRPPIEIAVCVLQEKTHPMFKRLALEELLAHQFALASGQDPRVDGKAPSFDTAVDNVSSLSAKLIAALPFTLTVAQQRVVQEIRGDCCSSRPMLRLLQGDVGSGKTLVAALAVCDALDAGFQAAIMAPTEILVGQHMRCFSHWLEPLGIRIECLVGSLKAAPRRATLESIGSGQARVVIGTHALFQDSVRFHNLGLLVIDEQHRFGVSQRLALRDKAADGLAPHQLVMTATPIPRSLAMAAYSHCDHSIIDELPPGRQPIQTAVVSQSRREQVIERLKERMGDGGRVYWVCPLIEESDTLSLQTIKASYEELSAGLPGFRIAMLHGRMPADEKEEAMRRFACGECQLLVATTVIEVGVDVPEATVMVIENAERFGLAQLHQLRGRVGRGALASHCVLIYGAKLSQGGRERLEVMRSSSSGFDIAEADLSIRGPGELLGQRQAGFFQFQIADWQRDADLLPLVDEISQELQGCDAGIWKYMIQSWVKTDQKWLKG